MYIVMQPLLNRNFNEESVLVIVILLILKDQFLVNGTTAVLYPFILVEIIPFCLKYTNMNTYLQVSSPTQIIIL